MVRAGIPVRVIIALTLLAVFALVWLRHAFLCDDAYISFRYARNLVDGHGLVFNPGERVEGYTNFLWVLIIALGLALGVAAETTAVIAGGVAAIATLWVIGRWAARRYGAGSAFTWAVPALLVLNRSFVGWSSGGLETMLYTLLVVTGLGLVARAEPGPLPRPWLPGLVLAAATLTRPDGVLFAAMGGVLILHAALAHRRSLAALATYAGAYAGAVGAHLAWRLAYYGDWVPNTFHAKVHGFAGFQARNYAGAFLDDYPLHWLAPLLALALWRGDTVVRWLLLTIGVYVGYLVYVGGDFLEFRMLVPVLPLVYLCLIDAIRLLVTGVAPPLRVPARIAAIVAAGALAAIGVRSVVADTSMIEDDVERLGGSARYLEVRDQQGRELRALIDRGLLPSDLLLATGAVGALPYRTGWPTIDLHGLTDAVIARRAPRRRGRVGHELGAAPGYLIERGVEMLIPAHRVVFELDEAALARRRTDLARAADRLSPGFRPVCRAIEPGRYLLFLTTLDGPGVERRFGALPPCE